MKNYINNLENILPLLDFNGDNYYFIQLFQRRKDNPDLKHPQIRLKCYSIDKKEDFLKVFPDIERKCLEHNARAYIRLNSQNSLDVSLRCIEEISKNIREGNLLKNRKVWDSVSGKKGENKFWVLDIDKEHLEQSPYIVQGIKNQLIIFFSSINKEYCLKTNPTRTGVHIITSRFDTRILAKINEQFKDIPKIDIQKDANTLLFSAV